MIPSPVPAAVFTVVFTATGLYALVRYAALTSGAAVDGDRMAELAHLVMSVAMIAMTWGWTGGPTTPGGVVQVVVFGLLGAWYLARVLRSDGHRRVAGGYHLVVLVAMVWMVAAMPGLMGTGHGAAAAGHQHHHGHGDAAATTVAAVPGPAPLWMRVVTVVFVVLLCAAAAAWATRAARPVPVPVTASGPVAHARPPLLTGPRLDASCHVLMSIGMAAMLLAML